MRWSYKTIHYDLQKEGLLGNAFLDESEVERSLNEYGKAGWELVSILETQEGLLAVFKQPLAIGRSGLVTEEETMRHRVVLRPKTEQEAHPAAVSSGAESAVGRGWVPVEPAEDHEMVAETPQAKKRQEGGAEDDIGSIRIE